MRLGGLCALALASTAYAYLDTAPFFLLSTSETLPSQSRLQSASSIVSDVALSLSKCPSELYVLVNQPGVTGRDYTSKNALSSLSTRLAAKSASGLRSTSVVEAVGDIDSSAWTETLQSICGVSVSEIDGSTGSIPATFGSLPRLIKLDLPAPADKGRAESLASNDALIASLLDLLPTNNYTVLYTTTRAADGQVVALGIEGKSYEMDSAIQDSLHMDLKRDLGRRAAQETYNQTVIDGPLFDKYQFFTPGIFMGFMVGLLLLTILYVAISAVASLQVTYAAFDKESGPLASKKQQ